MSAFQFRGNSNHLDSQSNPRKEFRFRSRPPHTADRPLLSTMRQITPEKVQDATKAKNSIKIASLSAKRDTSDDDPDPERPRKKRTMSFDGPYGPQDTTSISLPCPHAPRWSNPDPYTAIPPPSHQTNKRVDVVKLIRKARVDKTAKANGNDELKDPLDYISLGIISESEPQSNAPQNGRNIPFSGPTPREGMYSVARRNRIRGDAIKRRSKNTRKPASKYICDGSVIKEWRPLSQETGTPWLESTPSSLPIEVQLVYYLCSRSY